MCQVLKTFLKFVFPSCLYFVLSFTFYSSFFPRPGHKWWAQLSPPNTMDQCFYNCFVSQPYTLCYCDQDGISFTISCSYHCCFTSNISGQFFFFISFLLSGLFTKFIYVGSLGRWKCLGHFHNPLNLCSRFIPGVDAVENLRAHDTPSTPSVIKCPRALPLPPILSLCFPSSSLPLQHYLFLSQTLVEQLCLILNQVHLLAEWVQEVLGEGEGLLLHRQARIKGPLSE